MALEVKRSKQKSVHGNVAPRDSGPGDLEGAKRVAMPSILDAMLCTPVKQAPAGDGWLHEIKYDGYRMLARVERGKAKIFSRNRREWTSDLEPIAQALPKLPAKQLWLDGEVVVLRNDGRTSFQDLQVSITSNPERLTFFAFDLLYMDGFDLREVPLIERKRLLRELMAGQQKILRYGDHFEGEGAEFFAESCRMQLEGIICKQRDSRYSATRGKSWLKVKCSLRQEMVIGGWTDPGGARTGFGALLLGAWDHGELRYMGKVGTGFDTRTLADIHARLRKLASDTPPFANPPRGADARGAHWVRPELVGEIEFMEWTREDTARHPSFKGLRPDKRAQDVVLERPVPPPAGRDAAKPGRSARWRKRPVVEDTAARTSTVRSRPRAASPAAVTLSNPDKVLYPEAGITKAQLAAYYRAIGAVMLPHVTGRPLTLVRCPNGWNAKCFYQKHVKDGTSELLTRVNVPEGDGSAVYMAADSVEALVALLQMGVLEIHPWGSRVPKLGHPDRMIFDFDPDEGLGWAEVVEAAKLMRTALEQIGLQSLLRTTGGKGLHVVVPIEPKLPWPDVKAFTKAIAESFARSFPERFTAKLAKASRGNRIFIDYLRNAEGATAIAPYSVRAKANAPVATPIEWSELRRDLRFDHFNIGNVPARLRRLRKDPWARMDDLRQTLTKAMLKAVGL